MRFSYLKTQAGNANRVCLRLHAVERSCLANVLIHINDSGGVAYQALLCIQQMENEMFELMSFTRQGSSTYKPHRQIQTLAAS